MLILYLLFTLGAALITSAVWHEVDRMHPPVDNPNSVKAFLLLFFILIVGVLWSVYFTVRGETWW